MLVFAQTDLGPSLVDEEVVVFVVVGIFASFFVFNYSHFVVLAEVSNLE